MIKDECTYLNAVCIKLLLEDLKLKLEIIIKCGLSSVSI